jgi:5-methyltetrahydropteroyltriglutamate--homocysteine methyltransferase
MLRSLDRIVTTHAGALPRSAELSRLVHARAAGEDYDVDTLRTRTRAEVAAVVQHQVACGIDSVNDGEVSKVNFLRYIGDRLTGIEARAYRPEVEAAMMSITARDRVAFPGYFSEGRGGWAGPPPSHRMFCTGPLGYGGHSELAEEIGDFRAALAGNGAAEAFLPSVTPGTVEHWVTNEHYESTEAYLFALADALHVEYRTIVDAGFLLQIDDPDLPDGWLMFPQMSVDEYRRYAAVRVDALNHALRDIPRESVRLHVCWGSFHGPHKFDIPLRDILDLILGVKAGAVSIEASNPAHEHEWQVFEDVKLPKDTLLIPGVVGHCTDFIEHPLLVAQRIVRYARLVGRENVAAGTDCGLGNRVGHPEIAWAKLQTLAEGARLATKELW